MSTYEKILRLTDTLIQQRGFLGFSYADLEKELGIRKASIHHHFPSKTDLGLAYCEYKTKGFSQLDDTLRQLPPGVQRLRAYLQAFAGCAEKEEMCGVYAMLSDIYQLSPELQNAVNQLAQADLRILKGVLVSGQQSGELRSVAPPDELAVIVSSAVKGALIMNRISPHNTYSSVICALMVMLDART